MAETEKKIADSKSQLEETKKASIAAQKAVLDEIERQMKAHQEQQIAAEREAMAKQIAQKKAEIAEADKKHKEEMEAMLQQWVKTEAARVAEQEAAQTKADNFDKALGIAQDALNPDSGNHKMAVKQMQGARNEILLGVASHILENNQDLTEQIGDFAKLAGAASGFFAAFGGDESSEGF
jgi:membrane protein involved in colicin uptake